jgi:hypothetical protein
MNLALNSSRTTGRPVPGRRRKRRAEDPATDATNAADAEIRRALVELEAARRRLVNAAPPLGDRPGRAAWLRSAAECTARDLLPRAIRALRAGLACRPAGDP